MTTCRRFDCPSCWFAWATEKPFVLRSTEELIAFANGPFERECLKGNAAHRVFLVYIYLHLIARGHEGSQRALRSLGWDPDDPRSTWVVWNIVMGEELPPCDAAWANARMLTLPNDPQELLTRMGIH